MASHVAKICQVLILLAVATTWGIGAKAQSPSSSCTSVLLTMSSCLNYITGNSSTPASTCCSALANVVQSQPQCLCAALNSGAASSLGITVNQTRALELPNACNVQTPPISRCNGAGGPTKAGTAAAPADSPAGVPDEEPEGGPSAGFPSGSGSKTVPQGTSDGSITTSSVAAIIFAVISCTSALAMF